MSGGTLIEALGLPPSSAVNQRVPKKLLLENGSPTAADKRMIQDGVEELLWVSALKPTTIGVPVFRDGVREYVEIAVLRLTLRSGAKAARLAELVHRAVPYPVLLLVAQGDRVWLSGAHKRWSQAEAGRTILEGDVVTAEWNEKQDGVLWASVQRAIALDAQPRTDLCELYRGWMDVLLALQASRVTGAFSVAVDAERSALRREALLEYARLDAEVAKLRAAGAKEKLMSRRVELNLELKRVEAAQAAARANL